MDREIVDYIIGYFSNLMTEDEKSALNYHMYTSKSTYSPELRSIMIEKGWISSDPKISDFLKNGYKEFTLYVAKRIMAEVPEKVFFNNCPKCHRLARTSYARQCRYCGHNWHNLAVAQFKLSYTVQLTGRKFFLLGQILKGEIKEGQSIDLTILGINKKPVIETIEYALKRKDGKVWEDIGLGTDALTEEEKHYLKNIGAFARPIEILS